MELAQYNLLPSWYSCARQIAKPESSTLFASSPCTMPQSVAIEAKLELKLQSNRSASQCTLARGAQAYLADAPASMWLLRSAEHTLTRCSTIGRDRETCPGRSRLKSLGAETRLATVRPCRPDLNGRAARRAKRRPVCRGIIPRAVEAPWTGLHLQHPSTFRRGKPTKGNGIKKALQSPRSAQASDLTHSVLGSPCWGYGFRMVSDKQRAASCSLSRAFQRCSTLVAVDGSDAVCTHFTLAQPPGRTLGCSGLASATSEMRQF